VVAIGPAGPLDHVAENVFPVTGAVMLVILAGPVVVIADPAMLIALTVAVDLSAVNVDGGDLVALFRLEAEGHGAALGHFHLALGNDIAMLAVAGLNGVVLGRRLGAAAGLAVYMLAAGSGAVTVAALGVQALITILTEAIAIILMDRRCAAIIALAIFICIYAFLMNSAELALVTIFKVANMLGAARNITCTIGISIIITGMGEVYLADTIVTHTVSIIISMCMIGTTRIIANTVLVFVNIGMISKISIMFFDSTLGRCSLCTFRKHADRQQAQEHNQDQQSGKQSFLHFRVLLQDRNTKFVYLTPIGRAGGSTRIYTD